jgi:hypothetical protein
LKLKILFGKDEKMKAAQKTAILPVLILFLAAVFAYAQPPQATEPSEEPNFAPPERFSHREGGPGEEGRPGEEGGPMEQMGRRHGRLRAIEAELISWLEKNEPETAKALAELKEKDQPSYRRRLSIETRKYREIIDAQQTNPALAELLKKDLGLKQKRNELLDKLKAATNDKQKEELTAQLKEVIGQRFDLIVQKKQIEYEELKKKLEELQRQIKTSQLELETFKNKKSEHIKEHMENLINKNEQFDWH